jgi:hypothetical protein
MITKTEAALLVKAYLARRSKYEGEQWQVEDANEEEIDHGWRVYVHSSPIEGDEMPVTCAFVLLVSRADGKVDLPRSTSIERDMTRLVTDPLSLNLVLEVEDLNDYVI